MADRVSIGRSARGIAAAPAYYGYSKVVVIVGKDADGNELTYEAGDDSGAVLTVKNPFGTQQIANDMLARIRGYAYKPITVTGAIMNPAAELGDGIIAGGDYSVIAYQRNTFGGLLTCDVGAPDKGDLEHELPAYVGGMERETNRKIAELSTNFTVELGRIESEINDQVNGLSSRVTQLAGSITSEVQRATAAEGNLSSRITQTADSITSEVQRATAAEGNLSSRITQTADSITAEVQRASDAEGELSTKITQTAEEIRAEVNGIYADEWANGIYYHKNNVVKITNDETGAAEYYKCKDDHKSGTNTKPGSGRLWEEYWSVVSAPTVQSMLDIGLNGISLEYESSDLQNSAFIKLSRDGVDIGGTTITMTNVVADELDAGYVFSDGMSLYGAFDVYAEFPTSSGNTVWRQAGAIGAALGNDGVVDTRGCMMRSGYRYGSYNYILATTTGVRMQYLPPRFDAYEDDQNDYPNIWVSAGYAAMQFGDYELYISSSGIFVTDGLKTKNLLS